MNIDDGLDHYKGYHGSIEYSPEDNAYHGRISGIKDLVSYESPNLSGLEQAFRDAVDDYIETKKQLL